MQIFADKQFENPIKIIEAFDNESFIDAFLQIEELRKSYCLLGYIRYEAKEVFLGREIESDLPLLYFEAYLEGKKERRKEGKPIASPFTLHSSLSYKTYTDAINHIKDEIACGNTYQVNYTYDWKVESELDGLDLYNAILPNQTTPYNAYIKNHYEEILCFSPELFFELEGNKIKTKPMKGTVKRGETPKEDAENVEFLKNDIKNRAENVMIVDLLRNDLGKIAKTGTVKVDKLFEVETHNTVHQMTSEVSAELDENTTLFEIFEALFPCGSVTGAPKINTMEIIDRLEIGKRNVYCGAIGLITPEKTVFSVPIRILQRTFKETGNKNNKWEMENGKWKVNNEKNNFQFSIFHFPLKNSPPHLLNSSTRPSRFTLHASLTYTYRVGGAIVWDSTPEDEWEETLTKMQFLKQDFQIVETMLVQNGQILYEKEHLARMEKSARELGFSFDMQSAHERTRGQDGKKASLLRLLLNKDGTLEEQHLPLDEIKTDKIIISEIPVDSNEPLLYHKTTYRPWYDEAMEKIKQGKIFDEIFFNEKGELTEGARSNIILQIGGKCYTPPVKCGLLNGVLRHKLLRQKKVCEKILYLEDLKNVEKIFCVNSVRGIAEVKIDCTLPSPLEGLRAVFNESNNLRTLENRGGGARMILIDNYDSFTYNIVQYLRELGVNPKVFKNDEITIDELKTMDFSSIIISPGPKNPDEAGVSMDVIAEFHKTKKILGICLGHQCIAQYFGCKIVKSAEPVHGKTSKIYFEKNELFEGLEQGFEATRYHSLEVDNTSITDCIVPLAFTDEKWKMENGEESKQEVLKLRSLEDWQEIKAKPPSFQTSKLLLMALRHQTYPLYGVQFHPEAILTQGGKQLISNFLSINPPKR